MIKDVEGEWRAEHLSNYSRVVAYGAHEPHEGCTGNLIVVLVDGHPHIHKAIAALIARAPSMLALLEKALPIIEEEAERRECVLEPRNTNGYYREMRELASEIQAEIDRATKGGICTTVANASKK